MRKLELLAPAKNLECGKAAIDHGADAVYIGAAKFGARASAGNSLDDIRELCLYAHQYGAKVYVTVNTIVYQDELEDTRALLRALTEMHVDALLVQDMAVLDLLPKDIKPLPALHASTQTDNRTAEKVAWLHGLGFERVVLARELSLAEIKTIHQTLPDVQLEGFVHGALCVSYSGVCYASQYCFQRSANRGACAQFCRMKFDLIDAQGREIEHQRHLLSLKDLCQIDHLEEMADAGICSFKIEGRLKDVEYVKNVVSAYSKRLNRIIEKRGDDYRRASLGQVTYYFEPDLKKTFNRGYTDYFLHRRQPYIYSPDTPKALGEYVGKVKEIRRGSFNVAGTASFANGDGLCFINDEHELEGFRINRAEGNRLFPLRMPDKLRSGAALYRNRDEAFSKLLKGKTAERKIPITLTLSVTENGFALSATGQGITPTCQVLETDKQKAMKPQRDNILRQLGKLGDTPYLADVIELEGQVDAYFIPSSALATLRREVVQAIELERPSDVETPSAHPSISPTVPPVRKFSGTLAWQPEYRKFTYLYNIANTLSKSFYQREGLSNVADAYEVSQGADEGSKRQDSILVMQCRHCLRYSLGYCVKRGGKQPTWKEPLYLRLGDGRRFRLEFKCDECQMNIYAGE
ncbi:putative protease YdcP [Prevotella sp. BV3P1]|uniref:peptidase U32 family protein n=1 Tax=Prevotellaceae TaxID=171552 RepID=UPI0003B7E8A4|nr:MULTISPECIES: U32 family peptidase [Prevotellaceae]ERT61437.1 putative protease YdcP [Prevotella sp. BV3P1]KGF41354.1 protease [Hoylesella buccalis DNF00985]